MPSMDERVPIKPTCQVFNLEDHRNPGGRVLTAWTKSIDNLKEVSNSNFCILNMFPTLKYSNFNAVLILLNDALPYIFFGELLMIL